MKRSVHRLGKNPYISDFTFSSEFIPLSLTYLYTVRSAYFLEELRHNIEAGNKKRKDNYVLKTLPAVLFHRFDKTVSLIIVILVLIIFYQETLNKKKFSFDLKLDFYK